MSNARQKKLPTHFRLGIAVPLIGAAFQAMDFLAFCDSISAPSLKAVAMHWHQVRGSKRMPSWEDIQPRAIAAQLSIVWSFKYDHTTGTFICRLAGDRITRFFGKNLRSLPLVDAQPTEAFGPVHAILTRVVREPAAYRGGGRIFKQLDHFTLGERIMLPLSTDGVTGDQVLGATEYKSPYIIPDVPVGTVSENEDWFSL